MTIFVVDPFVGIRAHSIIFKLNSLMVFVFTSNNDLFLSGCSSPFTLPSVPWSGLVT